MTLKREIYVKSFFCFDKRCIFNDLLENRKGNENKKDFISHLMTQVFLFLSSHYFLWSELSLASETELERSDKKWTSSADCDNCRFELIYQEKQSTKNVSMMIYDLKCSKQWSATK